MEIHHKSAKTFLEYLLLCGVALLLTACGGGGGGGGESSNQPPIAKAGAGQSIEMGVSVRLDGSNSVDADSDLLTYQWSFTSVPAGSSATLVNAKSIAPTFIPDLDGLYVVQLVVSDGNVDSAPSSTQITITEYYGLGGAVNGLYGELVIRNNSSDSVVLSENSAFSLVPMAKGTSYSVVILQQPTNQVCRVDNGNGVLENDVTDIEVVCNDIGGWAGTQQFGSDESDDMYGITLTENGRIIVVGYGREAYQGAIFAYFANGRPMWSYVVAADYTLLEDVTVDDDGNIYVVGYTRSDFNGAINQGNRDVLVLKLNPSGTLLWSRLLGGERDDVGYDILIGNANEIYIAGHTESTEFEGDLNGSPGWPDVFVMEIDSRNGATLWSELVGGEGEDENFGGLATNSDGELLVSFAQSDIGSDDGDIVLYKMDRHGNEIWQAVFGDSGKDVPRGDISIDENGNIFLGGYTKSTFFYGEENLSSLNSFVIKLSSDGSYLWSDILNDPEGSVSVGGVALDSLGNVVLVSTSNYYVQSTPETNRNIFVSKWSNSGTYLWEREVDSDSLDSGNALVISSLDDIYVTGNTYGNLAPNSIGGKGDGFVIKVNSSGNLEP